MLLPDGGGIVNPLATYPASTPADWTGRYHDLLDERGDLMVTIAGFLIEVADRKIVMDTGFGPQTADFPGFGPFIGGKFLDSLARTGARPEEITDVVYTHLHLDHVGWTTREVEGRRVLTFPHARHRVTELEWNFWYGRELPVGPDPERVQKPLAGVIQFMQPGEEIAPGISVLATPGHTPGHVSLLLDAGSERMNIVVDLLHSIAQFGDPDWCVPFDVDEDRARATRKAMFAELVQPNTITADAHFSDRVFGRVTNLGGRVRWTPL